MAEYLVRTRGKSSYTVSDVSGVDFTDDGLAYFYKGSLERGSARLTRAMFPLDAIEAIILTKPDATNEEIGAL